VAVTHGADMKMLMHVVVELLNIELLHVGCYFNGWNKLT